MDVRVNGIRRTTATVLSVAILALSVAIPVLERADLVHQPVLESEHNPATCPPAHDHTICTQVGANASAPAEAMAHRQPHSVSRRAPPTGTPAPTPASFTWGHRSRAPPVA